MSDKRAMVRVKDVKKYFVLPQFKKTSVKNIFVDVFRANSKKTRQKVLDGVSFDVYKGDFFGIVGRNGSGKSTLLKILAGVYQPTSGSVELNGKLTPFIELGVGFNPELSGRDNVYLNGALLGFTRKQMDEMYNEIVDFAELGPFMDQKLKNYSSGMQVRLAFSIAIKAKNEILIFDEVLAVGDEAFQQKCLDVFERYKAEGQTVILVTHDMGTVRKFCNRALVLDAGKILKIGHPQEVASIYSELNFSEIERDMLKNTSESVDDKIELLVAYKDTEGKTTTLYKCGELLRLSGHYKASDDIAHIVINVYKRSGEHISGFRIPADSGAFEVDIEALFSKGKYYTLFQPIDSHDAPVGSVIIGSDFIITTDRAPDRPGWSGLVPINYKIVEH